MLKILSSVWVSYNLHKMFMVSDNSEVVTALGEILRLFKRPSSGLYLDSAVDRNMEPAKEIFQPLAQHSGYLDAQLQCVGERK